MNEGVSQSESCENLSIQQTLIFNYAELKTETQVIVQKLSCEIKSLMRRNAQDTIDIGQKLIEVKQHLGHGSFIKWLKSEFNWSVSTATKFMQVWEQFKFVKFTNLNITSSALYLIAAPSTSKEARAEVLERASFGESITYTKAKDIVYRLKKTEKPQPDTDSINISAQPVKRKCSKSTDALQYKASTAFPKVEVLTEKEVEAEKPSLLSQDLKHFSMFINENATNINQNRDRPEDIVQTANKLSIAPICQELSDVLTNEIAISLKNLTPEQLAFIIKKSANDGLSNEHLKILITEAINILNQRQEITLSLFSSLPPLCHVTDE